MKSLYLKRQSFYRPQQLTSSNTKKTFNFYDESNNKNQQDDSIDHEARSLMSSRMSKQYSRSLHARKSSDQLKSDISSLSLSRRQSEESLAESKLNKKIEMLDYLKSNQSFHNTRTYGFAIEKQSYSEMFAQKVNYQGVILFEPNQYLLPINRMDKKKQKTKPSDISLLLFNEYMKKSNQQKKQMAKVLQKQYTRENDIQNSQLNYMKKSEFKNNNFYNKNLKRKLIKNIAKQTIEDPNILTSNQTTVSKKNRSLSNEAISSTFITTSNSFYKKEQENIQPFNSSQRKQFNPYGTGTISITPNNNSRYKQIVQKVKQTSDEKRNGELTIQTGSKTQTLQSIYQDRISNLSRILNDQKQSLSVKNQTNLNNMSTTGQKFY